MRTAHVGTRRSEKRATQIVRDPNLHPEEDARHPGFHTVIVPKFHPQDPKRSSPMGWYEGNGYTVMSKEASVTGHSDQVLMGIPIDTWLERQKEQEEMNNSFFNEDAPGFEGLSKGPGANVEQYIDRKQSGLRAKPKANLDQLAEDLPSAVGIE